MKVDDWNVETIIGKEVEEYVNDNLPPNRVITYAKMKHNKLECKLEYKLDNRDKESRSRK